MAGRYGLQIRTALPADAAAIALLAGRLGLAVSPAALEGRLDAIRRGPGTVLLAEEWGPPSGLVALAWFATLRDDAPVAEITALAVDPDGRRRGIGRALLKAASQAARSAGCRELRLAAVPGSRDLQAFCLATGFEPAGEILVRPLRKRG